MELKNLNLGISIGDVNGVGPEIFIKTFQNKLLLERFTPVIYANKYIIDFYTQKLSLNELPIHTIDKNEAPLTGKINLVDIGKIENIEPGIASEMAGEFAILSLKEAISGIKNGIIHNLVTLPIDKNTTHSANFSYAGHTDFLSDEFDSPNHMMLLFNEKLKVGVLSGHIPISKVTESLTKESLSRKIDILIETLRFDFGITKPKIAIMGLNPHAGDNGTIGQEELEIIAPTIQEFIEKGNLVYGPFAADGFFGTKQYEAFDAVLAMYHDQGLIPFKQLAFEDGVNFTAGLPIIRTSPDHGTAYDIAGQGKASISSFVQAIYAVNKLYQNRMEFNELHAKPLAYKEHRREKFSIGVPKLK